MLRDAAEEILPDLIERARRGDFETQRLLLDKGIPRLRPVSLPEPFTLPASSLADQAKALVALVASGSMSTTVAAEIAALLTAAAKVEEVDQLRDELKALRTILEGRHEQH